MLMLCCVFDSGYAHIVTTVVNRREFYFKFKVTFSFSRQNYVCIIDISNA